MFKQKTIGLQVYFRSHTSDRQVTYTSTGNCCSTLRLWNVWVPVFFPGTLVAPSSGRFSSRNRRHTVGKQDLHDLWNIRQGWSQHWGFKMASNTLFSAGNTSSNRGPHIHLNGPEKICNFFWSSFERQCATQEVSTFSKPLRRWNEAHKLVSRLEPMIYFEGPWLIGPNIVSKNG